MKIALVTTTITPPEALEGYRMEDASVPFIVAGDKGANDAAIRDTCQRVGNTRYMSYDEQASLGYAVHSILGPHCIQRRNVAILEAIKSGAEAVVTIDTDNFASDGYFDRIQEIPFIGGYPTLNVNGWFNPGSLGNPPYVARGFPDAHRHDPATYTVRLRDWVANVGIRQGMVLGDPDTNAVDRIVSPPVVEAHDLHDVFLSPGNTWAPINSQNTAYIRELTPLMGLPPGLGRFDDIFSGYIAQRVLMDTDYHVAFGQPFVRQERHPHNLISDLKQEMFGMEWTEVFTDDLKAMDLSSESTILGKLALVYDGIVRLDYMPEVVSAFGRAWVEDVGSVL